jgi:hypothetical protein
MPPTTPPRSSFLLRHRVPDDVRQPLLDVWLWIATVFGTALIATNAARNPDFRWTELKVFFYGAVQLVVLVAALWRRGPPPLRSAALGFFFNAFAIASLLFRAGTSHTNLYLTIAVLLAGALSGLRLLLFSFGLGLLWYGLAAYAWVSGHLPLSGDAIPAGVTAFGFWADKVLGYVLTCGAVVAIVAFLIDRLTRHSEQAAAAATALAREQ